MLPQIILILIVTTGVIVTSHSSNTIAIFIREGMFFAKDQLFHTVFLQNSSKYHLELVTYCFLNY